MEPTETTAGIVITNTAVPESVSDTPQPEPVNNKDIVNPKVTDAAAKKHEKSSRKKDGPSADGVLRSLNSYDTVEKKLKALCKMHANMLEENKNQQLLLKQTDKRVAGLIKEKEIIQTDYNKAVLTKSRLESLCRELQRQNKAIKEESLLRIKEEEEKRKEISAKFQGTLAEITTLMNDINDKNSKLRDDNTDITNKFKTVCAQYDVRVQQVEKISNQMQLESQLADAKLKKAQLEAAAEKEALVKEKQCLMLENAKYQARIEELLNTEGALRSQISVYTEKYEEFHSALSRSNEVFVGFKDEMDKMSKKIVKLEKETASWKHRWEKSHAALLEMAADKEIRDQEIALSTRQLNQLQKLCRTLTEERAKLMSAQAASNGEGEASKAFESILEENKKMTETLDSLQTMIAERERLQQIERNAGPITIPPVSSSPPASTPVPPREDKKKSKKQKNRANSAIAATNQNGCAAKVPRTTTVVNGIPKPLQNGVATPSSDTATPKPQSQPETKPCLTAEPSSQSNQADSIASSECAENPSVPDVSDFVMSAPEPEVIPDCDPSPSPNMPNGDAIDGQPGNIEPAQETLSEGGKTPCVEEEAKETANQVTSPTQVAAPPPKDTDSRKGKGAPRKQRK